MLKVNVGLSRKVSRDYNSTGFSIHLEGEVCVPLDDPELIVAKIQELYDLAEVSLNEQIERNQAEASSPVSQPAPRQPISDRANGSTNHANSTNRMQATNGRNGNAGSQDPEFVPATNKQIQFLVTLAKRQGLTKPQLEKQVADMIGRAAGIYDLSKQEAGMVLDRLSEESKRNQPRRR